MLELLNNIGNPHYRKPGSILYMHSPTYERLCQHKVDWHCDGMLGMSQVRMAVMPADDLHDLEYYNSYTLSTLATGIKVWFAFPPLEDNLINLQAKYKNILKNTTRFAMENLARFQYSIAIIQQVGQTLMLPPFWITARITTQTSVSCAYHVATATTFAE